MMITRIFLSNHVQCVYMLTMLYTVCVFATIEGEVHKYYPVLTRNTCLANPHLILYTAKTGKGENNCFKLYTIKLPMCAIYTAISINILSFKIQFTNICHRFSGNQFFYYIYFILFFLLKVFGYQVQHAYR